MPDPVAPGGVDLMEVALDILELALQLRRLAGELVLMLRTQVMEIAPCVRHSFPR